MYKRCCKKPDLPTILKAKFLRCFSHLISERIEEFPKRENEWTLFWLNKKKTLLISFKQKMYSNIRIFLHNFLSCTGAIMAGYINLYCAIIYSTQRLGESIRAMSAYISGL